MRVYEIKSGPPARSRLFMLSLEAVASYSMKFIRKTVKHQGEESIRALRSYLGSELPASILKEVLDHCIKKDMLQCNHNPTECSGLELWRTFFHAKFTEVNVVHHEFAFPKTTNYPDIIRNLDELISLILSSKPQISSFKIELEQCESRFLIQDQVLRALRVLANQIRVLEIPGLCTNELLHVIAFNCTNLEVLNIRGSREQVDDRGFIDFLCLNPKRNGAKVSDTLKRLDISRCTLSHQVLFYLGSLRSLSDLVISTTVLDDIHYSCEGQAVLQTESGETFGLDKFGLSSVTQITVEHETILQVSINKVMAYLQNMFPNAKDVHLNNCIACEMHVTLSQHPTQIAFMRENIQSLELISADYFEFPRLVYPCPNLERLSIEKPTNDIFNTDMLNVPLLYGNPIPFANLKNLSLSRISLTNLTHFLSKSNNLKQFKVFNIGRRERPRWTDDRVKEILTPTSVPRLEEFHVSCLPNEGFSTSEMNRYLHLTKETIRYLTHNFKNIKHITGVECWNPRETNFQMISSVLNSERNKGNFSITLL